MTSTGHAVTRRTALLGAASAGLVAAGAVRPTIPAAKPVTDSPSEVGEKAEPPATLVVAAVQMEPDAVSATRTTAHMVEAVRHASAHSSSLDLVAFPSGMFASIHRYGAVLDALVRAAQTSGCVLTFGARSVVGARDVRPSDTHVLIEPTGRVSVSQENRFFFKDSTVGRLVMRPSELQHDFDRAGADLDIVMRSHNEENLSGTFQFPPLSGALCSVVVNRASFAGNVNYPTTAIFDGAGRMVTQTGNRWTQTIVASLPRRRLQSHQV